MSLSARLVGVLLALTLIAGLWWKFDRMIAKADAAGYQRRAAEDKAASDAQAARNRDMQRQAELRYTVAAQTRDRFFVTTVREIRDAAAPLAACPVPEPVRVRLNAAAACARGDSAAACGPADEMPSP